MSELKIGDKLHRYVTMSGIWKYEVIGVHEYKSVTQYVIRCESCSHGWKCELLIVKDDYGRYSFVSMLNHQEDDDQRYWHYEDEKRHFHTTVDAVKLEHAKILLAEKKEAVKKCRRTSRETEGSVG